MLFKRKGTKSKVLGSSTAHSEPTNTADEEAVQSTADENTEPKTKKSLILKIKSIDWQLLLTNKKLVGFCCVGAAAIAAFVVTPFMHSVTVQPEKIVVAMGDVAFGQVLTKDNLTLMSYSGDAVPQGAYRSLDEVAGKFANVQMFANDIVTELKVRNEYPGEDNYLAEIPKDKLAISVTAKTDSAALANKLRKGDIVSIYTIEKVDDVYVASCPEELKAVEIIAVTNANIEDIITADGDIKSEEKQISTITCIVNDTQAALLAAADSHGEIHAALRLRGNPKYKAQLLEEQELVFKAKSSFEENETQFEEGMEDVQID